MISTAELIISFLGGLVLGAFFFGMLKWTVNHGLRSDRPALWFFSSLVIRVVVTVGGIYLLANGDWRRALMCVLGFIVMRVFFILNTLKR